LAGALIVIEIAAPKVSDEALAVLVSSCTRAARGAECVLAKNSSDASPSAVAIVSAQGADKMRVEVGVREGEHDSWRTKDFAFLAEDDALDRWRAVGFAIGTLAESDAEAPAEPAEPLAPAPPAPAPAIPVAPPPEHRPRVAAKPKPGPRLFVAALGVFGPGLDRGPWRIGSGLGVELAPARLPVYWVIAGSAATRVTRDESGATARWFDVSTGPGVALLGSLNHSGLELGAALLAERFEVSATTFDGASAARGRWLIGAEGTLGGRLELAQNLFLVAEAKTAGLSATTDVRVLGTAIGSAPSFRFLGCFGLRVRLR